VAKARKVKKLVETLTHTEAKRKNIPTAELQSAAQRAEEITPFAPVVYPRRYPLAQGETRPRDADLDPQLVWKGARVRLTAEQIKKAAETANKHAITGRPADLLKPEWDELRALALALPGCNGSDEDVLTNAMFPQVAPRFFASRKDGPKNLGKAPPVTQAAPNPKSPSAPKPEGAAVVPPPAPSSPGAVSSSHPKGGTVSYVVTLNGTSHNVTVTPVE